MNHNVVVTENTRVVNLSVSLRPCVVDGKKALFHRWMDHAYTIPEPMTLGNPPGGQVRYTRGLVEFEDGSVREVRPETIVFRDGAMRRYMMDETVDETTEQANTEAKEEES